MQDFIKYKTSNIYQGFTQQKAKEVGLNQTVSSLSKNYLNQGWSTLRNIKPKKKMKIISIKNFKNQQRKQDIRNKELQIFHQMFGNFVKMIEFKLKEKVQFLNLLRLSNIFLNKETMISSVTKLEPIQGLSKREQSKLERLMKSDQIQKAQYDAKSYKRKASKTKHPEEPEPRKLSKPQQLAYEGSHNTGSIPVPQEVNSKSSPSSAMSAKRQLKVLKPFNSSLPIQGGEAGLFDYMIGYVCTQKQKQMEAEYEDTTFLDVLEGKQLQIVPNQTEISLRIGLAKEFQQEKHKITLPFDETHRSFLKKVSPKHIGKF